MSGGRQSIPSGCHKTGIVSRVCRFLLGDAGFPPGFSRRARRRQNDGGLVGGVAGAGGGGHTRLRARWMRTSRPRLCAAVREKRRTCEVGRWWISQRPCAPPRAWGTTSSRASRCAAARCRCRTCRGGRCCRPWRPWTPPRARCSTFLRASLCIAARWQKPMWLRAPTAQGVAVGWLGQNVAPVRAAAYAKFKIFPCVYVRGGGARRRRCA